MKDSSIASDGQNSKRQKQGRENEGNEQTWCTGVEYITRSVCAYDVEFHLFCLHINQNADSLWFSGEGGSILQFIHPPFTKRLGLSTYSVKTEVTTHGCG